MNAERWLPPLTLAATLLLVVALFGYGADPRGYWTEAFADSTLRTGAITLAIAALLRLLGHARAINALAALAAIYVAGGIGVMPAGAVLLALLGCLLLGQRLLAFMFPAQAATASAAILCGVAVYLALFGLMVHFPVNYRAVYVALLAAPLVAEGLSGRLPALWQQVSTGLHALGTSARALPYPAFAAAVVVGVLIARFGFVPTVGFDDNALHLGLWAQLLHGHVYEFDFRVQMWEVAPFAVDLLHASVNLVAGTDARGATNLALFAMLLRQLWVMLGALQLTDGARLLVLALFVSTPMAGYSLISMQTELFMALLAATGVRLILELRADWCSPYGAALLALAALACATKLPGAGLGVMLLAAACLRLWSLRKEAKPAPGRSIALLGAFTLVLATLAFNAYLTAWVKTGNPVYPLYNAIFQSPYYPLTDFTDTRWIKGFSLASYWDLFFNTSAYYESKNFVAGFQYLLLFPLGLAALLALRPGRAHAYALLIPLFGYALFVFAATQYWRYQFPVLPLATVAIGALLAPHYTRLGARLVKGALMACIALNLVFYPGISGIFVTSLGRVWTQDGKTELISLFAPARILNDWLNTYAPGSRVLYPEAVPYGATLDGTPVYVTSYAPETDAAFHAISNEAEGLAFMRAQRIDYVIAHVNAPGLPGTMNWGLRDFLSRLALPILQAGDHILYRFEGSEVPYTTTFAPEERFEIDANPRRLGAIDTGDATAVRYNAEFACADDAGYFAAQINWNNGDYYYHEIPCSRSPLQFLEAMPVPPGASGGELWGRSSGTTATLTRLSIETH